MKSSLGKLRGFKLQKNDAKDKRDTFPSAMLDELAQASQDMRDCYDSLLSAAAAIANSAYEFSESLQEMGSFLLKTTAFHENNETGKILLFLGNLQLELQKIVDTYRSHVFLTITSPSESLLSELRTLEDMKRQCDGKRSIYEYMLAQQKEKGRSKNGKGKSFTQEQLQTAYNEFDEEATMCIFRMKSLKQRQLRSLLTQAARHYAAQLNFFRKGLRSLEAVEPQVKLVTEQQHIDYQFSGLANDGEDKSGTEYNANESRDLSIHYRQNKLDHDVISMSRDSMEVDEVDVSFPQISTVESLESNPEKNEKGLLVSGREPKGGSHSAPIIPDRKPNSAERFRQMQESAPWKSNTYALPTPIDVRITPSSRPSNSFSLTRLTDLSGSSHSFWHSSPSEQKKHEKDSGDSRLAGLVVFKTTAAERESNSSCGSTQIPTPLREGVLVSQLDARNTSDSNKTKQHSFPGPRIDKAYTTKPALSASGPIPSNEHFKHVSGIFSCSPVSQPTAPSEASPSTSPPFASSPRTSELQELPRPPRDLATKTTKSKASISQSAPLIRNPEPFRTNKIPSSTTNLASRLPPPPLLVSQSFSVRSSSQRTMTTHASKLLESPKALSKAEEVESPPLTPIFLAKMKLASTNPELIAHSDQIGGGSW
ncbi:hypothetical protein K2173_027093 [Erythroxylum novogranatense]|uniref:BAR domain-containing protein n=1 Tax=Erythroxylum novogranatense TaxID=1862640 RepID=A0AAV8TZH4_9ROSI|nr:hypothetical protein K2173_027093 [Erythroxylum novogranatense]